jgi:hypothetical protein
MALPPHERAALEKAISPIRLQTYRAAAATASCDDIELYLWDRDLAAAAMADIAILEVALRNSMNSVLTQLAQRSDWYAIDMGLDNRSLTAVVKAWGGVPITRRTPDRVVAQLMFGFWRDLLEAGGDVGAGPLKRAVHYEDLWRAGLRLAFPGGRQLAAKQNARFTRTWTLATVKEVHALRNRVAHHEPLVNGYPMPGEQRRLTAEEGLGACTRLAHLLDRNLASWFVANSHMTQVLATRP